MAIPKITRKVFEKMVAAGDRVEDIIARLGIVPKTIRAFAKREYGDTLENVYIKLSPLGEAGLVKMGSPPKQVSQKQFEELCRINCTKGEICAVLGASIDKMQRWTREVYGLTFTSAYNVYTSHGKSSLRRSMYENATVKLNPTVQIFLAKSDLQMSDKAGEIAALSASSESLPGIYSASEETSDELAEKLYNELLL